MAKNRKAFEQTVIAGIEQLCPGSPNTKMYRDFFAGLSDEELDTFVNDLRVKKKRLSIIAPNFGAQQLRVDRNLEIAKEWGHNFYERIWMNPGNGIPPYLTPRKYLVIDLPLCRQAQHLVKKISIPEDDKTIDDLSGQPTGGSKGSKISYPEVQILSALNLEKSLTEFLKARGGDQTAYNALITSINQTGGASLDQIEKLGTKVQSQKSLSVLLMSMALDNTLGR